MNNNKSYRSTFKNTVAFGGVQILTILISLVRGKAVAFLLGPTGMGINNLFVSSLNIITTFTELGLELSAVREISNAKSNDDQVSAKIKITEKLFLFCGILGFIVTILFSPLLSKWTFGNSNYTVSYIYLSVFVFFTALNKSYQTVLRGLQKINLILKSSIIGSLAGLVISLPFFYFLKTDGIVPSIIASMILTMASSLYFRNKIKNSEIKISVKEVFSGGKEMAKLGLILIFANLLGIITKYLINIYISNTGSIADIGFYGAAISIGGQYVGFILASLSAEYFPKLSAANSNNIEMSKIVNEQSEVVLLLATPLLLIMMITAPLLIRILLTKEFLVIESFIRFIAMGSFFQMSAFCMGYISFAKNDKKVYLFLEGGLSNVLQLLCSILGYYFFGLKGLAIAFLSVYVLYFVIISIFTAKRYEYRFSEEMIKIFSYSCFFITLSFAMYEFANVMFANIISILILIINLYINYRFLTQKVDIKNLILSKLKKR